MVFLLLRNPAYANLLMACIYTIFVRLPGLYYLKLKAGTVHTALYFSKVLMSVLYNNNSSSVRSDLTDWEGPGGCGC